MPRAAVVARARGVRFDGPVPCLTYVCILASRPYGAIRVGSTNDLRRRVEQHRNGVVDGHTKDYDIHGTHMDAVTRERRIKKWQRLWKNDLVIAVNPERRDPTSEIPIRVR